MTTQTKVYIYCRSANSAHPDYLEKLAAQQRECEMFCHSQHYAIAGFIEDVCPGNEPGPNLLKVLSTDKTFPEEEVFILAVDHARFSRSLTVSIQFHKLARESGYTLKTVAQPEYGLFTQNIMALAELLEKPQD